LTIAGLTGGLACGKSFVASALRDLGCYVVEADHLGHEVMAPGGPAYQPIVDEFGAGILDTNGTIDRARLATIVFSDPARLATLNAIVHPAVHQRSLERFREIEAYDPKAVVIYVAAILIETNSHRDFDKLIVVTCTPEQQFARAMSRPGAREADVRARLESQLPLSRKAEFADYPIDAGGTIEDTLRQTKMVFEELKPVT
jgi:dephospho-CoA kinase